jgi:DNA-binding response OmpR family regulator
LRVLVIEEEAKLAPVLERYGQHAVISVRPGEPFPAAGQFDAVVIDSRLTLEAALVLCRNIRSHEDVAPVLVLTDEDSSESRIEAFAAGADACLSGTLVVEELLARLRALVRRVEVSRSR